MKHYHTILIILFFLINEQLLFSETGNSWCENNVNLSKEFAEYKNQGDLQHCYAFSATSLIENYECRKNPKKPCSSFSVMDAITQNPDAMNMENSYDENGNYLGKVGEQGGDPIDLLKRIKKNGLCREKLAPYKITKSLQTQSSGLRQLGAIFDTLHNYDRPGYNYGIAQLCNDSIIDEVINEIVNIIGFSNNNMNAKIRTKVIGALSEPNKNEFLRALFVSDECIENRKKSDFRVEEEHLFDDFPEMGKPFPGKIIPEKDKHVANTISSQLNSGIPILVYYYSEPGAGHSLIVKGMRKNRTTGKCEVLLHNSWGKKWQQQKNGGYVDADAFISGITTMSWLADDKSNQGNTL